MLLGISSQGKIPHSPFSAWAVLFHFCLPHCIWLSPTIPRGQRCAWSVSQSVGTRLPRGHASWRQSRVGSLAFLAALSSFPGGDCLCKMVSLPNEERSKESSYLRVVVFSNGKLRGPVSVFDLFTGIAAGFLMSCLILLNERCERWAHFTLGHLTVSFKCTIFLHLFIASKTSLNLGHVCVHQEKRQIWKQYWCTRGHSQGAYRGRLYPNGAIRETWAPKGFCEAGSMSRFFLLQSSNVLAHLLYLSLWRWNMAHLLIFVQLSSLNQNQNVVENGKFMWEAFIFISETRN